MKCPECNGTGKIVMFTSAEQCAQCLGSGVFPVCVYVGVLQSELDNDTFATALCWPSNAPGFSGQVVKDPPSDAASFSVRLHPDLMGPVPAKRKVACAWIQAEQQWYVMAVEATKH